MRKKRKFKRIVDFYYSYLAVRIQSQQFFVLFCTLTHTLIFPLLVYCFVCVCVCLHLTVRLFYVSFCLQLYLHFYCYIIYQMRLLHGCFIFGVYLSAKRMPKWYPEDLLLFDTRIHTPSTYKNIHTHAYFTYFNTNT